MTLRNWWVLISVFTFLGMQPAETNAQQADTTDWALVLVCPGNYIDASGGGILSGYGAYLLTKGDTAKQVDAILKFEAVCASAQAQKPKHIAQLRRLGVIPWSMAFQHAKMFSIHPLPFHDGVLIRSYTQQVRQKRADGETIYRTFEYHLERVPIWVFPGSAE